MNIKNIVEIINSKGYICSIKEITKGSIIKQGINVSENGSRLGVVIYPDNINANGTDEEIADSIISTYEENKNPGFNTDNLLNADYVKEHCFVTVRKPVEDDAFSKPFLDLQMVVRVSVDDNATFIIKNDAAKQLGLTDDLFKIALANEHYEFHPMGSIISDMTGVDQDLIDCGMYVVSNKNRWHGSGALCDTQLLTSIAFLLDTDLIIIPSSIHELIILRNDGNSDAGELNAMVREVNAHEVLPEEQLSDHIYYFNRTTKEITW